MVNCFFLSSDAKRSARYACDQHVGKIALEMAQVLWAVQHTLCAARDDWPDVLATAPICASTGRPGYGKVHANHPFARFARRSPANYQCLVTRGLALADEHRMRMGKDHSARTQLAWLQRNPPPDATFDGTASQPDFACGPLDGIDEHVPICVPEEVLRPGAVVSSYRNVYRIKAAAFRKPMRWTNRRPPKWLPRVLGTDFKVEQCDRKQNVWRVVTVL